MYPEAESESSSGMSAGANLPSALTRSGRYFDGQGYLLARLGYQFQVNGETYITDAAGICSRPYQSEGAPFVNASDVFETLAPDDVVSGDYEFQAKVNENTVVEPFGFDSSLFAGAEYADHIYWCNLPDDSLKGQIILFPMAVVIFVNMEKNGAIHIFGSREEQV